MSKRTFLATLLALSFGNGVARADAPTVDAEQTVLASITALRSAEHLPALVRDADLDEAALIHAEDMAAHDFVGHVSARTGDPAARARAVGARVRRVGENVARAVSPEAAIASLESSDAHRAQILSNEYSTVGVAVVEDDEGFYVVEVFGASVAPEMPPPAVSDVSATPETAPVAAAETEAEPVAAAETEAAAEAAAQAQAAAVVAAAVAQAEAQAVAAAEPIAEAEPVDGAESFPEAVPTVPSYASIPVQPDYAAPNSYSNQPGVQFPSSTQAQTQNGQGYAQPTAQGYAAPSTSTAGAPVVMLQGAPPRNVSGYWVQAGGRWWYYPVPPNARPGQVLTPSTTATGGPNTAVQTAPARPYVAPPAPRGGFFRPSPRRW